MGQSIALVHDGDSSLTRSWKGCIQKPADTSTQICGDDLSHESGCFLSDYQQHYMTLYIILYILHILYVGRKNVSKLIGI